VDKLPGEAPLAVVRPNTTPTERVPAVMDFNLPPDMGRMSA
jgi:hypothetical protein